MSRIINRRMHKHKSTVNKQRFLKRYRKQIQEAVAKAIAKRSITEIEKGEQIKLSKKDIHEPHFSYGNGGVLDRVFPGNRHFSQGEALNRPNPENQQGSQASDQGEAEDDFSFELSKQEFLDLYFEDLALPHLVKKAIGPVSSAAMVHAGFSLQGSPANLHVVRTLRQSIGRRTAIGSGDTAKKRVLKEQLEKDSTLSDEARMAIANQILALENKKRRLPFIEKIDLRFRRKIKLPKPMAQAVMFCIMDVSGSMDETKKDIAKRFFSLLYLFLTRHYQHLALVFIRHHTLAKIVDEETFFYSKETGGTVVSSALQLMKETMDKQYSPDRWNIYAAQASDGDNWYADTPICQHMLMRDILPKVQYFAYIEIMAKHHQSLWDTYAYVKTHYPQFAMQDIQKIQDIYPVFRELFKKDLA